MIRVGYIGNFRAPWCTEVHVARALRENGCEVREVQQDTADEQPVTIFYNADLVLYTRTHNATALGTEWTDTWRQLADRGITTASFHLDRFWDLDRERLVTDEPRDPLFTTQHVFTADGGSDARWLSAGVNHHWLPPAVDRTEAESYGRFIQRDSHDVVFVGSGAYHKEYPQRDELLRFLHARYGPQRFAHYGHGGGRPVVRGQALNDLLASARVVVGDSCFANAPNSDRLADRYWSDRVPEVLGRGGLLIHPANPTFPDSLMPLTHEPGNWDALAWAIDQLLDALWEYRSVVRTYARQHVLANHTYTHRMRDLLCTVGLCADIEVAA